MVISNAVVWQFGVWLPSLKDQKFRQHPNQEKGREKGMIDEIENEEFPCMVCGKVYSDVNEMLECCEEEDEDDGDDER